MNDPQSIQGYATASPVMQVILERLDGVRWIGPGRWLATCLCCGEPEGAEFTDVWDGAELTTQRRLQ